MRTAFTFRIGSSRRDQVVRAWMDEKHRVGQSISDGIKDLIYQDHVGSVSNAQLARALYEINRKIEAGQLYVKDNNDSEPRPVERRLDALDNFKL